MARLRALLAASAPPVPMKAAWLALLRALRAQGRADGTRAALGDRAALERLLDQKAEPEADALRAIKAGLRDLVHAGLAPEAQGRLALELDERLRALVPAVAQGEVELRVEGWPPGLDEELRSALLGRPWVELLRLPAEEAAALVFALDGRAIGGRVLRVLPVLPPGTVLPAVPRDQRDRSPREGSRTWLPQVDPDGRRQLSPLDMARRQAACFAGLPEVIDAFAGCGGNALALAMAGHRVFAIEQDPARAALLEGNAAALGLSVSVQVGDARELLPPLLRQHPQAGLFLDPPWGGPGSGGRPVGFSQLLPLPLDLLQGAPRLVLKAPRAFDLASLPRALRWTWRYEPSPRGADGRVEVLAITCVGHPRRDGEDPEGASRGAG